MHFEINIRRKEMTVKCGNVSGMIYAYKKGKCFNLMTENEL